MAEQTSTEEYVSPYKMLRVEDVEKCQNILDKITKSAKEMYTCLDGTSPSTAYEIGRISVYAEMIRDVLDKEG